MINIRNIQEFALNQYDKPPQSREWTQREENIEFIIQKIKQHNRLKHMHNIQYESIQENDPFLKRRQQFTKKLEQVEQFHEEKLETYRKILDSDRQIILNTKSQRKLQGSIIKHVRSISINTLKPLIQQHSNNNNQHHSIVSQTNEKIGEQIFYRRRQIKSIQENRQILDNCQKRLSSLFKEECSSLTSRDQSKCEQRNKNKKSSFTQIRNLY